ncbi:ferritin family protein [Acidobacteriota bacterium]
MTDDKKIDIIKKTILLEHRGKTLYESVVKTTKNNAVKELFEFLVKEEQKHVKMLNKQYGLISSGKSFDLSGEKPEDAATADRVLTGEIVSGISGAGYEATVISAALDFEKKAVKYYSEQADSAGSAKEKKLYDWFAGWEKNHMKMLAELEDNIKKQVWYNNSFWPLD